MVSLAQKLQQDMQANPGSHPFEEVEGPKSPEEMLTLLQRVLEETSTVLVAARLEAEERIKEEQDVTYQAALEADHGATEEGRRKTSKRKKKRAREAADREDALVKLREEKGLSLGPEPEKGHVVTQVLVRLPNGERKEYAYTLRVNEKSDTYSFGVVILELVTGKQPVAPEYGEKDLVRWVCATLDQKGLDAVLDPKLDSCFNEEICKVLNVGVLCTSPLPINRPSMRKVVKMLQ
ncbi:hypothetical protein M8C21_002992 [Ambrosia artemisiifolia]|uniref:Uncharacterized protein n=1 Tax=Ambrosia artemisiifolia TaxID=4212 RepID=A0AAD5DCE7_AMBAR|nr:hypothetical protein M8C21_002992 [Ambrosia artemisiifolia]